MMGYEEIKRCFQGEAFTLVLFFFFFGVMEGSQHFGLD